MVIVYLKLRYMREAAKHPGEAYQANAKGGGHWDKYFWIMFAAKQRARNNPL